MSSSKSPPKYVVRPWDTRPRAARTSQGHVFELGPKKFEMNEFMKWKPWAARVSDHLAFTLLSNKSCTNFELHEFFLSPKNVHLKTLLYPHLGILQLLFLLQKALEISLKCMNLNLFNIDLKSKIRNWKWLDFFFLFYKEGRRFDFRV